MMLQPQQAVTRLVLKMLKMLQPQQEVTRLVLKMSTGMLQPQQAVIRLVLQMNDATGDSTGIEDVNDATAPSGGDSTGTAISGASGVTGNAGTAISPGQPALLEPPSVVHLG